MQISRATEVLAMFAAMESAQRVEFFRQLSVEPSFSPTVRALALAAVESYRVPAERIQLDAVLLLDDGRQVRVTAARRNASGRIDLVALDTRTAEPVYLTDTNPTVYLMRVA